MINDFISQILYGDNSILPSNSSKLEKLLEGISRNFYQQITIKELIDVKYIDTMPSSFLEMKAIDINVDTWNISWADSFKRSFLKRTVIWHTKKGTRWVLIDILNFMGLQDKYELIEGFTYGQPYEFTLSIDLHKAKNIWSYEFSQEIINLMEMNKPLRCGFNLNLTLLVKQFNSNINVIKSHSTKKINSNPLTKFNILQPLKQTNIIVNTTSKAVNKIIQIINFDYNKNIKLSNTIINAKRIYTSSNLVKNITQPFKIITNKKLNVNVPKPKALIKTNNKNSCNNQFQITKHFNILNKNVVGFKYLTQIKQNNISFIKNQINNPFCYDSQQNNIKLYKSKTIIKNNPKVIVNNFLHIKKTITDTKTLKNMIFNKILWHLQTNNFIKNNISKPILSINKIKIKLYNKYIFIINNMNNNNTSANIIIKEKIHHNRLLHQTNKLKNILLCRNQSKICMNF